MAEFEAPTAVTTQNNSSEDLQKLIAINTDNFVHSKVYKDYQNRYVEYLAEFKKNPLVHEINEQLWPRLTGHTLVGPTKIAFRSPSTYIIDPTFLDTAANVVPSEDQYQKLRNSSYTFFYLGEDLTGHAGIVHGGLLATILDEITCRLAFLNFPSKKGVTASLNISYKKPCFSNNYILLRCDVVKRTGRKCWVKGLVFQVDSEKHYDQKDVEKLENLLTECDILVIEPRWVDEIKNKVDH